MSGLKKVQTPVDDPHCPYCNAKCLNLKHTARARYDIPGHNAYHVACTSCGSRVAVLPVRRVFVMTTRKTDKLKDDFDNTYADEALTDKAKVARRMLSEGLT